MSTRGSVRLEGIVKRHGETTVLRGVDLAIEPGEFFVLLGPSGSGKTTTLRILAGLEEVSEGKVFMDGADVTTQEPGQRDVAMVFQSYALYPHMTVAENIGFPLRMVGTDPQVVKQAVADAADKVGIGHLLDRTPGRLSGGQQQRCALARAIVRKPRLFLLDEPLSNLDAKLRLQTRLELHTLQRTLGATTVYVAIALSGLTALAAEVVWTRVLSLLFGATVYTFSLILAVFLVGLGIGSSLGSAIARGLTRPRTALGIVQLLLCGAIAWTAYMLTESLPFWPINPSIASTPWFTLQLDLVGPGGTAARSCCDDDRDENDEFHSGLCLGSAEGADATRLILLQPAPDGDDRTAPASAGARRHRSQTGTGSGRARTGSS